jgi:hypothetical protein
MALLAPTARVSDQRARETRAKTRHRAGGVDRGALHARHALFERLESRELFRRVHPDTLDRWHELRAEGRR